MAKTIAVANKDEYQNKLLNINYHPIQLEMKEYARINHVPIMQDGGIAFLISLLKIIRPKRILEIGTAIGYSSSFMALNSNAKIDTIERDHDLVKLCNDYHTKLNIAEQVKVIESDALTCFDILKDNKYDFIFIDAAKAQYIKFFEMYSKLLSENGVILSDNLYFHDLLFTEIENRDLRQLVRKVDSYNDYLLNNENFETHIFNIGDGVGVTYYKDKRCLYEEK